MSVARYSLVAAAVALSSSSLALATTYLDESFSTAASASNYNVYMTTGVAAGAANDATFGYDYGALPAVGGLSIPVAPHTTDGSTTGLRLRTDNLQNSAAGQVVGAISVASKGLVLPSTYKVSVDIWSNYIGGTSIASSGSNGSTGVALGLGTSGNQLTYISGNDGFLVEAFGDNGGGADGAYRVYPNAPGTRPIPTNSTYYAAGTTAGSATFSNAYYTSAFPSVAAPAGQVAFSSATQGGTTPAGVIGFAWHTFTLTEDGTNVIWAIDGKTIATVPNSAFTTGGSQVTLANIDTGLTGNSAALNQLFNAEIFDNLSVTDYVAPVPEPTTLAALAGVGAVMLRRRRAR